MTNNDVEKIYKEFAVPLHIRRHMAQVEKVAIKIANAYIEKGTSLDLDSLSKAALLHDALKVCTIRNFDPNEFEQEVTEKDVKIWYGLRQKYGHESDAITMKKILSERGEKYIGELIAKHDFACVLEGFPSLEAKILYYADKRVKHDEIVSLEERLRDGRERYVVNEDQLQRTIAIEKAVYKFEEELFAEIDLNAEDIV